MDHGPHGTIVRTRRPPVGRIGTTGPGAVAQEGGHGAGQAGGARGDLGVVEAVADEEALL